MESTTMSAPQSGAASGQDLQEMARRHLWLHFTRMGGYDAEHPIPIITRGEGVYVYDEHGNRYLDGLSGLFCCNAGHGRAEIGEAMERQVRELDFITNWSYAHPGAIELAARIASLTPGDLNRDLLHVGRLRGGRVRAEAGAPILLADPGQGPKAQDHRPRGRLPRDDDGRAHGDRPYRRYGPRSSRSPRAAATCRTRTPTTGPRAATRSGRPRRSPSGSSSRAPRRSPP